MANKIRKSTSASASSSKDQIILDAIQHLVVNLRSPITNIVGFANLIENNMGIDVKTKEYISHVSSSANMILSLIYDLIDASKIYDRYQSNVERNDSLKIIDDSKYNIYNIIRLTFGQDGFIENKGLNSEEDIIIERVSSSLLYEFNSLNIDKERQRDILSRIVARCGAEDLLREALSSLDLPVAPPNGETFDMRANKKESAPEYIGRVYGQWLTGEFTRADLRRLDKAAEMGLRNWERSHGRAPLNLPTVKERNDRLIAEVGVPQKPDEAREYDRLRILAKAPGRNPAQ